MGTFIKQLGQQMAQQTGTGILGGIFGAITAKANDKRQLKQQQKLQDLEIAGQKQMGEWNFNKQLEFWNKTNYGAQVEQLQKAGLNPGLLYGMGGAGGATTGSQGGDVQGGTAPQGGGEIMAAMGIQNEAAKLSLLKAQKENIEADTANKQADTQNKPLVGENIQASTANLTQDVKNKQAQEALTEIQTNIAQIEEHIKGATQNAAVATIMTSLRENTARMHMLERENEISRTLMEEKIQAIKAEYAGIALRNALTREQTKLPQAQIEKMVADIKNTVRGLDIQNAQQTLNDWAERAKIDLGNKGLNLMIIKSAFDGIMNIVTATK